MRLPRGLVGLSSWFALFACLAGSGAATAADDGVLLGRGAQPRAASAPLIATPEEIERMRRANVEISAGFARLDGLLKEISASRTKIKQVIESHQELALCVALQQARNEATKLGATKAPLSHEQKQALVGYEKIHTELAADIRKAGVRCPSALSTQ